MKTLRVFSMILVVIALIIATLSPFRSIASNSLAATAQDHIRAVEQGLLPAVIESGAPPLRMSIDERMKHYLVPGVSIAVIKDYKIEWAKGYGKLQVDGDKLVDTETLFQAASMSKPVASMGAMRLVQEGKLGLGQDVNQELISWKVPQNNFTKERKVTLEELMTHSAGMNVHGFMGYSAGKPLPTVPEILDGTKPANSEAVRVVMEPGTKWQYSGGGITVMQLMMMDATHKQFPELMRQMVLGPIGMEHSTYEQPLPEKRRNNAAIAHQPNGKPVEGKWNTYPEMAAAGLWTTPSDLARFSIELSKEYLGESDKVLSQKSAQLMLASHIGHWGLGIGVEGQGKDMAFSHGGSNVGFRGQFIMFPETGMGAAVMTNSDNGSPLCDEILRSISAEYGWSNYKPKEVTAISSPSGPINSYVGGYAIVPGFDITVSRHGDRLFLSAAGSPETELIPIGPEKFVSRDDGFQLTFERTDINQVIAVVISVGGQEIHGKKVK